MARRRNTVHDLANLRLHPDGSRVHNTDRQSKYLALDARGNRIAVDAGGSGRVKKRRRAQSVEEEGEDQEDIDIEKSELSNEQSNSDSGSKLRSKQKEKEKSLKDPRAKKRHKAQDNQAFFESETHAIPSWEDMGLPNPSSDLLKCIHHFATDYYYERGELLDATKEARQEKKQRKLKKLGKQRNLSEEQDDDGPGLTTKEDSSDSGSLSDTGQSTSAATKRRKGNKPIHGEPMRDMYKLMDGTALMALGMLFQENLGRLLHPKIAQEWERTMRDAQEDLIQEVVGGKLVLRGKNQKLEEMPEPTHMENVAIGVELESDDGDHDDDPDFAPSPRR